MAEHNLDNIQQNVKTDRESSTGLEHFPPSTFSIHSDNGTDNKTQESNKDLSEDAIKISKSTNETLPNITDDTSIETSMSFRNSDQSTWRKIMDSNNKRQEIFTKFKEASQQINPIEFESYYDFFVLNTFKKGKSASGHVDIENVMKNNAQHHRRSKRNYHEVSVREPINSSGSSFSDDGEGENYNGNKDIEKLSRGLESPPVDEITQEPKKRRNTAQLSVTSNDSSRIDEVEVSSSTNSHGGGRRSTRLLNKANNNGSSSNSTSEDGTEEHGEALIKDLYESIVPKVAQPYRRSDWVLPSRLRYTPDKQMRTKPEFEKVNLSDLVSVEKIQRVLSKFEGGLKGIRKTNWSSIS
ncbi:hypothetical protein ZYGR_0AF01690 [Zygosaccharomyces rouxii]|uniref:Uncharacterized protein n=1 Tax=Zygosaccharomyces rouxii TaxID=4956 RepID=A0A1Q3A7Q3_ZYGRO|nr:hypothetical protein ZYGR_0AF01690 [Zygosaccharomyces rouxii]